MAAHDGLLSEPEEPDGRLTIREAMAKVVSRTAVRQPPCLTRRCGTRRLSLWRPFAIADPNQSDDRMLGVEW